MDKPYVKCWLCKSPCAVKFSKKDKPYVVCLTYGLQTELESAKKEAKATKTEYAETKAHLEESFILPGGFSQNETCFREVKLHPPSGKVEELLGDASNSRFLYRQPVE